MTEPSEAMKAMARRIVAQNWDLLNAPRYAEEARRGDCDNDNDMALVLAAIIETQEACAKVADDKFSDPGWTTHYRNASSSIATAIRTGNHYGKDESHGN